MSTKVPRLTTLVSRSMPLRTIIDANLLELPFPANLIAEITARITFENLLKENILTPDLDPMIIYLAYKNANLLDECLILNEGPYIKTVIDPFNLTEEVKSKLRRFLVAIISFLKNEGLPFGFHAYKDEYIVWDYFDGLYRLFTYLGIEIDAEYRPVYGTYAFHSLDVEKFLTLDELLFGIIRATSGFFFQWINSTLINPMPINEILCEDEVEVAVETAKTIWEAYEDILIQVWDYGRIITMSQDLSSTLDLHLSIIAIGDYLYLIQPYADINPLFLYLEPGDGNLLLAYLLNYPQSWEFKAD